MLEHMVVVDCLQCILAGMDVRAIVREITLEDERARISVAISRSMIRARVSALGQNVADVTVLSRISPMSLSNFALEVEEAKECKLTASMTLVMNVVRPSST